MNAPLPCSSRAAVGRGALWPMYPRSTCVPGAWRGSSALPIDHLVDGVDDGLVAGAAAIVARNVLADLLARALSFLPDQVLRGHEHARRAEAALQRIFFVKTFLQASELLRVAPPLHRRDL